MNSSRRNSQDAERLAEKLFEQFESQWSTGQPPDIGHFVQLASEQKLDVATVLEELVRIDLEFRYRHDAVEILRIEDYRQQHADLPLTIGLIQDESQLQLRHGHVHVRASAAESGIAHRFAPEEFSTPQDYEAYLAWLRELPAGPNSPDSIRPPESHRPEASGVAEPMIVDPSAEDTSFADSTVIHGDDSSRQSSRRVLKETSSLPTFPDRYQSQKLLGEGSFGAVWLAFDQQLQRRVAIKTLHENLTHQGSARVALLEEARSIASLQHPNLVTIHDVIEQEASIHLVMQWIDGLPINHWASSRRKPGELRTDSTYYGRIATVMAKVCRGIAKAHQAGLIHCDLKPANILVDTQDEPVVLDFGLAVSRSRQEGLAGSVMGTPAYMSPEQTYGETHHLDGRADVWSLGVILYQLLTGELPFHASVIEAVFEAIQTRPLTPVIQFNPEAPSELIEICERCLQKRIEDRYPSAMEVADALERVCESIQRSEDTDLPSHLPWTQPELIGREDVIDSVAQQFHSGLARQITLTGVGGIGKTQTAVAISLRLRDQHGHRVVWSELAAIHEANQLPRTIASSFGMADKANQLDDADTLARLISLQGPLVLVLDNAEQVVDAVSSLVPELLQQCPQLSVMVTSQLPLQIRGEQVVALQPLSHQTEAVELFLRHARASRSDCHSDEDRQEIAAICQLLDGNPLAIELAASRASLMGPKKLRKRLGKSLNVLKDSRRDRPLRHRSLHEVVRWSFDLLDQAYQAALLRIAIWPAPLCLEMTEPLIERDEYDSLDIVEELRDRSLIAIREMDGEVRLVVSTAVRQFAEDAIEAEQCESAARELIDLAKQSQLCTDDLSLSRNLLAAASILRQRWEVPGTEITGSAFESDCVRLVWAVVQSDHLAQHHLETAFREQSLQGVQRFVDEPCIEQALRFDWSMRLADVHRLVGKGQLARKTLQQVLADATEPVTRVAAKQDLAELLFRQGKASEATKMLEEALELCRHHDGSGDPFELLIDLADLHRRRGHTRAAEERLQQAEVYLSHNESGPQESSRLAEVLLLRGKLAFGQNQLKMAETHFTKVLEGFDGKDGSDWKRQAYLGAAAVAAESGEFEKASELYDRCESLCRRIGDLPTLARVTNNRALALDDAGQHERCLETLDRALELYQQMNDAFGIAVCLIAQASAHTQLGQPQRAIEILESSEVGSAIPPGSIHDAIRLGELGIAQQELGGVQVALTALDDCLSRLDDLCDRNSADGLLYEIAKWETLCQLDAGEDSPQVSAQASKIRQLMAACNSGSLQRHRIQQAMQRFQSKSRSTP